MVQTQPKTQEFQIGKLDWKKKEVYMLAGTEQEKIRLRSCEKEPATVKWLEDSVGAGDVVYDIGANTGPYALVAANLVKEGHVYAFEPGAANYTSLCMNTRLNACSDRLTPLPFALGVADQIVQINLSAPQAGAASNKLSQTGEAQFYHPAITVPLDTAVKRYGLRTPTLVKMDVDGHEPMVMMGAESTFRLVREAVIEVNYRQVDAREFIIQTMWRWGFKIKEKHALQSSLADDVWNVLFTRNGA